MTEPPTYRIPRPSLCPSCGHLLNAAGIVDPHEPTWRAPEGGDTTVCAACAAVLVFQPDLSLRNATPLELAELLADPDVLRTIAAIREGWRVLGRPGDNPRSRKN